MIFFRALYFIPSRVVVPHSGKILFKVTPVIWPTPPSTSPSLLLHHEFLYCKDQEIYRTHIAMANVIADIGFRERSFSLIN